MLINNQIDNTKNSLISALYIVATPIGNLADITIRALVILENADVIFAEDTRVAKKLLFSYGINTKVFSLHEHNEQEASSKIISLLQEKKIIAQITDAGTPGICDPGVKLVRNVRNNGFAVIPIPGCSALITALSVSGIDIDEFLFLGFLPSKNNIKNKKIKEIAKNEKVVIIYESPHRIIDTLEIIDRVIPNRKLVLARELTKLYETFLFGTAKDLLEIMKTNSNNLKGEMILIFEGCHNNHSIDDEEITSILNLLATKFSAKDTSSIVARLTDINKHKLYQQLIDNRNK